MKSNSAVMRGVCPVSCLSFKGGTAVLPKSQWTQESGRELLSVKCECRDVQMLPGKCVVCKCVEVLLVVCVRYRALPCKCECRGAEVLLAEWRW